MSVLCERSSSSVPVSTKRSLMILFYFLCRFVEMRLEVLNVLLIATFEIFGLHNVVSSNTDSGEVVVEPAPTEKVPNKQQRTPTMGAKYTKVIYDLFGIHNTPSSEVIYAPGVSAFVKPAARSFRGNNAHSNLNQRSNHSTSLANPETNTISLGNVGTNAHSMHINVMNNTKFGLPGVSLLSNLFSVAENLESQYPGIEGTQLLDRSLNSKSPVPNNDLSTLWNRNHWREQAEKQKWQRDVEAAKHRQTRAKAKTQKEINHEIRERKQFEALIADKEALGKKLIDMITQGLHPMQQLVSDSSNVQKPGNAMGNELEKSEVPGLHSLQAYANPEINEWVVPNSDPLNPVGTNLLEPSANDFLSSVQDLRMKPESTSAIESTNTLSVLKDKLLSSPNSAPSLEFKTFVNSLAATNELPSKLREPVFEVMSSNLQDVQKNPQVIQDQPRNFGLQNGINNHPNILNYFKAAKTERNQENAVQLSFVKSPTVTKESLKPVVMTTRVSISNKIPIEDRDYSKTRGLNEFYHGNNILSLREKFPVNLDSLPSLQLTADYLPLASLTSAANNDKADSIAHNAFRELARSSKDSPLLLWNSNVILPSITSITANDNSKAKHISLVDSNSQSFDPLKDEAASKQTRFAEQFKPLLQAMVRAQLNSGNGKRSAKSVPLVVSRSKPVGIRTGTNDTVSFVRTNNRSNNRSSSRSNSSKRTGKLIPVRQRWGLSHRNIVPVKANG